MTTTEQPTSPVSDPVDPIDHEALRRRYRAERDKRLRADGNEQYLQPTGRFAGFLDDPYVERVEREPAVRRGHRGAHRRRVRRPRHRGPTEAGRHRRRPHHRGRRRRRRRLVLEPLPGGHVRHRGDDLPAAARRHRVHADPEVHAGRRDLRPRPTHRHPVRPLRQRPVLDRGHRADVGRRLVALAHPHRPRRRHPGQVRGHGHRTAAPAEAARHPGHRDVRGPQLPHQPVGLRLHRWRPERRAARRPGRQAGRHHRHRRHRGAVHPAPGPGRAGALRLPADAVVDRHPQQPRHRPRLVRRARARLAAEVADQLRHAADRRLRRRGPREGRMDRHLPAHPRSGDRGDEQAGSGVRAGDDPEGVRGERRREDDRDPGAGRRHRRGRAGRRGASSPGTASCASDPASTTSTSRPTTSRVPT